MGKCNVLKKNGKRIEVGTGDEVYVGLDVHTSHTNVTVRLNGQEAAKWMSPPQPAQLIKSLMPIRDAARKVVYEAGPCGFELYRELKKAGFPAEVWPPGKMPRPANQGNKTDRLDASTLATYAEKDLVEPIVVPTRREEAERQVMRTRNQLMKKLRRVKQQIKSFLTMHGIEQPEGLGHWTRAAVGRLRRLPLRDGLRTCLDVLVDELSSLEGLVKTVEKKLRDIGRSEKHADSEKILRSHPGIGRLTAMNFMLEVYRPERFEVHRQVSTFVGLVPRVSQSGDTRRDGPLKRAGRESLRAMLVQAAWQWVRRDARANKIYQRLVGNTGCAQKAIVGMARKICVNLWCMWTRGEYYRPDG